MSHAVDLTLAQAVQATRRREVSCIELVEATLARIAATEPAFHAYAEVMADRALARARTLDDRLRRGAAPGALHGVPIGVKDLLDVAGVPTRAGSHVLDERVPEWDATVVGLLDDAGAVVVGKTVTDEFGFGAVPPLTRNAWNPAFSASGSSAGSAVAVALRSAFGAIGTDSGGSIRAPASVNGVVGLKPTRGLVSCAGMLPMSPSLDHVGPIARTVEDCALLLGVIARFDPRDQRSIDLPRQDYTADLHRGIRGLRIGIEASSLAAQGVPAPARDALRAAASVLEELGAEVVDFELPAMRLVEPAFYATVLAETASSHRALLRDHADRYGEATRILLALGERVPAVDYLRAQRARTLIRHALRSAFATHRLDALIAPGDGPAELASDATSDIFELPLGGTLANLIGLPALSVPSGFTPDGLPLSVELYGRPLAERVVLRIAAAYEAATGVHPRPPAACS